MYLSLNKLKTEIRSYLLIFFFLHSEPYEIHKDLPPKKVKRHPGASEHVLKLCKHDLKVNSEDALQKPKVTICSAVAIPYGNPLKYMLYTAPYSKDLKRINIDAMKTIEPLTIFDFLPKSETEETLVYNYVFHKWANQFGPSSPVRLRHCIHAYLLKHGKFCLASCIPETTPKNTANNLLFMKIKPYNEDFDKDPSIDFTFLLSKHLRKLLTCTIEEPKEIRVNYCEYFEEYDKDTMIQIINMVYENCLYYDCKFFPGHDVLLLRFKQENLKENRPYSYYSFRTPICFRDFCGYIIPKDTDWLYTVEFNYWNKRILAAKALESKSISEVYSFNESDFIRPGSIKDRLMQEKLLEEQANVKKGKGGKGKGKGKKDKAKGKGKKSKSSSSESKKSKKSGKSDKKGKEKGDVSPPKEPVIPVYEGYNIGDIHYQLRHSFHQYFTSDGYSVATETYHWTEDKQYATIKVGINSNILIYHFTIVKDILKRTPFCFHISLANGIVMGFTKPLQRPVYAWPCDKRLATYIYTKTVPKRRSRVKYKYEEDKFDIHEEVQYVRPGDYSEIEYHNFIRSKKEILDKIKIAARTNTPVFKICSSRLHKYLYVKRIKSHLNIPIGQVIKRLTYKPKLTKMPSRHFTVTQCLPKANIEDEEIPETDFIWRSSLPTGLIIQLVSGIEKLYIKQGYMLDREDTPTIKNEDYRCFLKGKVISFRKNGEVMTMHSDKTIENRQYGYFSSNVSESATRFNELRKMSPHSYDIHRAIRNKTKLEKRIRRICKRHTRHLIDLSENYTLESKREALRREKKTCKLSKKLHQTFPEMLPLLKLVTVTDDGSEIVTTTKSSVREDKKYFTTHHNDYLKRETLLYREDGVTWFLNNKGYATTQFPDQTRITTWETTLDENFYIVFDVEELAGEAEENYFAGTGKLLFLVYILLGFEICP